MRIRIAVGNNGFGSVLVVIGTAEGGAFTRFIHPELNIFHNGGPTAVVDAYKSDGVLTGGEVVVKLGQHYLGGKRTTKIGITQV